MATIRRKLVSSSLLLASSSNHCYNRGNSRKNINHPKKVSYHYAIITIIISFVCFCCITLLIYDDDYYRHPSLILISSSLSSSNDNDDSTTTTNNNETTAISKSSMLDMIIKMIDTSTTTSEEEEYEDENNEEEEELVYNNNVKNNVRSESKQEKVDDDDKEEEEEEEEKEKEKELVNNNKSNGNSSLPHLVIHVGPPKTATTTIQQILSLYHHHHILFDLDRYIYMGNYLWENDENKALYKDKYENDTNNEYFILGELIKSRKCHYEMNMIRQTYEDQYDQQELQQQDQKQEQQYYSYSALSENILPNLSCAQDIVYSINYYSSNNTNLLISDETLSIHYKQYYGEGTHSTIFDWISLYAILYPYYQITVIGTYRRFYDWLPSAKQQAERWTKAKPRMNTWPLFDKNDEEDLEEVDEEAMNTDIKNFDGSHRRISYYNTNNDTTATNINNNMNRYLQRRNQRRQRINGKIIEPILPDWWKNNMPPGTTVDMPYYYTDSIMYGIQQVNYYHYQYYYIHNQNTIINMIILNMHDNINKDYNDNSNNNETLILSIRSQFFCQALPDANHLCQYSKQLDFQEEVDKRKQQEQQMHHQQQQRQSEEQQLGDEEEHSTNTTPLVLTKVMYANPRQSTSYDELVVGAAQYHYIDMEKYPNDRHVIVVLAKEYHEILLSLSSSRSSKQNMMDIDKGNDEGDDENSNDNEETDNRKRRRLLLEQQGQVFEIQGIVVPYNVVNNIDHNYEFSFICPSDNDYREYLNQSLLYEEAIVPDFYNNIIEYEKHISDFWYHAHVKRDYCTIDISTILKQHRHWKYFFKHIIPMYHLLYLKDRHDQLQKQMNDYYTEQNINDNRDNNEDNDES